MASKDYCLYGCDFPPTRVKRKISHRARYFIDQHSNSRSNPNRKAFLRGQRGVFESLRNGFSMNDINKWVKDFENAPQTEENIWTLKGARAAIKEIKSIK